MVNRVGEHVRDNGLESGAGFLSQQVDTGILSMVVQRLYINVGTRFAMDQWSRFLRQKERSKGVQKRKVLEEKGFGFNADWVEFIRQFLFRFLLEKITFDVSNTVREVLLKVLEQATMEGWGVDKTVREMKDLPFTRWKAAQIVRTEVTRAANTGAMAAGSTFEYEQVKEWISAEDRRVRGTDPKDHASHVSLNGQVIDYDDYFTDPRNGDLLRFPGDPGGNGIPPTKAASTINCRCNIAVTAKLDRNGRLIPKRKSTVVIPPGRFVRQIITI